MKAIEQLERLKRIYSLIKAERTGSPDEFARSLHISRRCLYENIHFIKDLGVDVQYSKQRRTFYSANGNDLFISYSIQVLPHAENHKINGGQCLCPNRISLNEQMDIWGTTFPKRQ